MGEWQGERCCNGEESAWGNRGTKKGGCIDIDTVIKYNTVWPPVWLAVIIFAER